MANNTEQRIGAGDDAALRRLRADFPGHRIWRGVDHKRQPGDWVATLHDPAAGIDPTVIRSTPTELRQALDQEAERARRPPDERVVHMLGEVQW